MENDHPWAELQSILKQWYNKDVFGRIEMLYREENGTEYICLCMFALSLVRKWRVMAK
jgi:hypothetical protein